MPFGFLTTNDNYGNELPLSVTLTNPSAEWQLKASGEVVADSKGFRVTGITSNVVPNGIKLDLAGIGKNKSYELYGAFDNVKISHDASALSVPDGSVVVSQFSNSIASYEFNLPKIKLTVPEQLVPNITSTARMFMNCDLFNQPIGMWDVSNVNNMLQMFRGCLLFNQPIGMWDVSNVTNMGQLFFNTRFNQDISAWDVSSVTSTWLMFGDNDAFNQPIGMWDVSNVTQMIGMFSQAQTFNQNISDWNVSNVTQMNFMLQGASRFNQDLSGWCVSLIPQAPLNFDQGAGGYRLPKPVWGKCPRGENIPTN